MWYEKIYKNICIDCRYCAPVASNKLIYFDEIYDFLQNEGDKEEHEKWNCIIWNQGGEKNGYRSPCNFFTENL